MANPSTTNPSLEKAKAAGMHAADKAKEAASSVGDMVSQAASSVGKTASDMASQAASTVGKTAENLTSSAGAGLRNLGDTLSDKGPHEGMLGSASQAVASTLKEGGKYIQDAGLSGMADDLTEVIRRNPVPAVLVGIGIGFLIGRVLRS